MIDLVPMPGFSVLHGTGGGILFSLSQKNPGKT